MDPEAFDAVLVGLSDIVRDNSDLCCYMMRCGPRKGFINSLFVKNYDRTQIKWKKFFPEITDKQFRWMYIMFFNGIVSDIAEWINTDFREDPSTIITFTTSIYFTPSTKKGTATPQKEGISFSWVAKNIFAVVIVLFLLNKFVLDVQPGYNWAYNMLQKNLETIRHYSRTTTDNRFEMKLGLSHVYLRYVKENTPENAVILLPGKEAFYPEGEERIFSGEPYNKLWAIRFLYPRRVIIPSELGKTPWSEKITHVAIVNGRGYEYLDYEVEQKAPHAVLPMHLKP